MPKGKVLIIEDDRALADVLSYNLKQAGYDVLVATDGQDGITQAQLKSPDVVLLDIMMTFANAPAPPEAGYYIFVEGFPASARLNVGISLVQKHKLFSHQGQDCVIFEGREFLTKRETAMQLFASPTLEVSPKSPNVMRVKWSDALYRQLLQAAER